VIIVEFLVFVISSGVFCSKNFRHRLWAVIVAGVIATGSSLLFMYDFAERMLVHTEAPVKVVKQVVRVPVVQHVSHPPALAKPRDCRDDYPFFARVLDQEGATELSFQVLTDGTVSGITVAKSSGYDGLDDAAKDCVRRWHYRPAIKDGENVDAPMTVKVTWNLDDDGDKKAEKKPDADADKKADSGTQ
jgi:TonB family protein